MRTHILHLLTAAFILMAACRKGEEPAVAPMSADPIRFAVPSVACTVETTPFTRTPTNLFPSGGSFGVLGYCLAYYAGTTEVDPTTGPASWDSKAVLSAPTLFYKQEVKYNGSECYYTGMQQRWYEPADYLYTFFAYYPYGDSCYTIEPATPTGIGNPALTYTMPFSGGETTTPRDLDVIPDAMAASTVDASRHGGHVALQFNHLLTGIDFTINNYNERNDLTIHGLRVSGNFYRSLRIRMNEGLDYFPETFAGTFTFLDGSDDTDDIRVEHNKSQAKVAGKTLLLVSNLEAGPNYIGTDISIHIDYTFMGRRITDKQIALPTGYLPQGGTIYTIEANFIGDAFILNFIVGNNQVWEDGGDSGIQFE